MEERIEPTPSSQVLQHLFDAIHRIDVLDPESAVNHVEDAYRELLLYVPSGKEGYRAAILEMLPNAFMRAMTNNNIPVDVIE